MHLKQGPVGSVWYSASSVHGFTFRTMHSFNLSVQALSGLWVQGFEFRDVDGG